MLENTFCHIQGIGLQTEKRLWEAEIFDWQSFLHRSPLNFGKARSSRLASDISASVRALSDGRASYFYNCLKPAEHWRLFKDFKHQAAYLDIETTGLEAGACIITTIAVYDGESIRTYVNGKNLDAFIEDIAGYALLVTYNGKTFDIPFIESFFGVRLPHAHIDLRYVLGSLGFKGGLKKVEKQMGLSRNELDGVDGYFAVLLWYEYINNGDQRALDTLIAYNVEDVVNLEFLMHRAYNLKLTNTPFDPVLTMTIPHRPDVPYAADFDLVNKIRSRFYPGF